MCIGVAVISFIIELLLNLILTYSNVDVEIVIFFAISDSIFVLSICETQE